MTGISNTKGTTLTSIQAASDSRRSTKISDDKSISFSAVNLAPLGKVAEKLIDKVTGAVGCLYEPKRIRNIAKAEADATLTKAKADAEASIILDKTEGEITDRHRRTVHRFLKEEITKQINMEGILDKALPHLDDEADPSKMQDDWVTNFFDKSRIVSDDEMQELWARVLAGEANAPGAFSLRTVNFLSSLERQDAELFQELCNFAWSIERFMPLVFDIADKIYAEQNLSFDSLTHLDSIGLIQFDRYASFLEVDLPTPLNTKYFDQELIVTPRKTSKSNQIEIGEVILTKIGREILTICAPSKVDGFFEYVTKRWRKYLP